MQENDYRKNAAQTVGLAHRATSTADKVRLLGLAEAWLDLADRAQRRARQQAFKLREHPLVGQKLGSVSANAAIGRRG
jgi:hypothetical protein